MSDFPTPEDERRMFGERMGDIHITNLEHLADDEVASVLNKHFSDPADLHDDNGDESEDTPSPTVFKNKTELLRFFECKTFNDLEILLSQDIDVDCRIDTQFQTTKEGFTVVIWGRGVGLTYPLKLDELREVVKDLEELYVFKSECESLADWGIELVEHFDVQIGVDYEYYGDAPAALNRRWLLHSEFVQEVPDYPYRRAMPGNRTLGDWLKIRFHRHYPGLAIDVQSRCDLPTNEAWTLEQLRSPTPPKSLPKAPTRKTSRRKAK